MERPAAAGRRSPPPGDNPPSSACEAPRIAPPKNARHLPARPRPSRYLRRKADPGGTNVRRLGTTAAVLALGTIVVGTPAPAPAATGGAQFPDIVEEIPKHLGIQNIQQHEVLRFSTTHWNF